MIVAAILLSLSVFVNCLSGEILQPQSITQFKMYTLYPYHFSMLSMIKRPRHIASDRVMRFLRSPLSPFLTRPWLDRVILWVLEKWFFPLSRLWASARAAQGSVDDFCIEADIAPSPKRCDKAERILANFEHARVKNLMTEQVWQEYLFGNGEVTEQRLLIAEEMRLDTRTEYLMLRKQFRPFRKMIRQSIALRPPTPEETHQRYPDQAAFDAAFALPEQFPEVEESRRIPVPNGQDYWIRFKSPSDDMQDLAYARVHEPVGVKNPPTLIFGHGIFVEFDHLHNLIDEVAALTRMGIRVVRPEAPWHGRRVIPGHFGGERLLSTAPVGMIEFLAAQTREWAVWMDWCRKTSTGPVAIGGSSLGAQTAKSIAVRAKQWPKRLQPDALFMVTHCTHIAEAALDGALSDLWHLGDALRDRGWNKDLAREWLHKLDPEDTPVMPPEQIVSVMGSEDIVTPFASGEAHMDSWQVPQQNRFVYPRGHFTIPLGLIRDQEALRRLRSIFTQLAAG